MTPGHGYLDLRVRDVEALLALLVSSGRDELNQGFKIIPIAAQLES
jgi:hypothetical protein